MVSPQEFAPEIPWLDIETTPLDVLAPAVLRLLERIGSDEKADPEGLILVGIWLAKKGREELDRRVAEWLFGASTGSKVEAAVTLLRGLWSLQVRPQPIDPFAIALVLEKCRRGSLDDDPEAASGVDPSLMMLLEISQAQSLEPESRTEIEAYFV